MNLPWLAWAFVAAILVMGLARAASCHEIEPSLLDLLVESPVCPECPACPPPPEWTVASEVHPDHPSGTRIETTTRTGWDPDAGALCAVVHARAVGPSRPDSAVSTIRSAERCIEVPEPPGMLAAGLVALALLGRSRGIPQATARPT